MLDLTTFSLRQALPSPTSAEGAPLCSAGSSVLWPGQTPLQRTRPPYGLSPSRTRSRSDREVAEVSRFSRILFLDVLRFSDYAGPKRPLTNSANARVAFPDLARGRRPGTVNFRSSIARPADASIYASSAASRRRPQDSRSRWFATSFLVGLFHSQQYAGLSRRSRDFATPSGRQPLSR